MNTNRELLNMIASSEFREFGKEMLAEYQSRSIWQGRNLLEAIQRTLKYKNYSKFYELQEFEVIRDIIRRFYTAQTDKVYEDRINKSTVVFAIHQLTF